MKKVFNLEISNLTGSVFKGECLSLRLTAEDGEIGILASHEPLLSQIKPGYIKITTPDLNEDVFYISGGFLEVQHHNVIILADELIHIDSLDKAHIMSRKEDLESMLNTSSYANSSEYIAELTKELAKLKAILMSEKKPK